MKKFKGILLTICLTFLIIDCAILLVTFVPVLYPSSLIASNIGVSEKIVRESYMTIIHYLSLFSHKALSTPAFPMTKNTAFHFYEVKVLMNRLEIIGLVVLIGTIYLIYSTNRVTNAVQTARSSRAHAQQRPDHQLPPRH